MADLQGAIQQVAADPSFQQLAPVEQTQYMMEEVLPKVDPSFSKFSPEEKHQYYQEQIAPTLVQPSGPVEVQHTPVQPPTRTLSLGDRFNYANSQVLPVVSQLAKGVTLGYLDRTADAEHQANATADTYNLPRQTERPGYGVAKGAAEVAGSAIPFEALGSASKLIPGISKLQPAVQGIIHGAAGLGGYEALQRRPGALNPQTQIDPLGRAVAGASGVVVGGTLGFLGSMISHGFEIMLERMMQTAPEMIGQEIAHNLAMNAEMTAQMFRANRRAVSTVDTLPESVKLGQDPQMDLLNSAYDRSKNQITTGVTKVHLPETQTTAEPVQAPSEALKLPEGPTKAPVQPLQGSIPQMLAQGLQDSGLTHEEAHALNAQVKTLGKAEDHPEIIELKAKKKLIENRRDEEAKNIRAGLNAEIQKIKDERKALRGKHNLIHPHLKEVLETGWDGHSPVWDQSPVDEQQLTKGQVEHLVTDPKEKAILDKTDEVLKAGVSERVEHRAEITGSTDAAATVTNKGNVKIPVSTFTPTHYTVTRKVVDGAEKDYVAVHGYNEAGHMSKYYINRTPEGSRIEKVLKVLPNEAHVGTIPNVELGPRKYKVADVLGKAPRAEGVLTSEAEKSLDQLAELFKPENFKQLPKAVRTILNAVRKRGRFTKLDIVALEKAYGNDKAGMETFCQLLGIHHG